MWRFPKSLYVRFFLSLWAVTVLTVGGALVLTWLVMTESTSVRMADTRAVFLRVAQTLERGGEPALIEWLRHSEGQAGMPRVLVVGPNGHELLGRALPPSVEFAYRFPDGGVGGASPLRIVPAQPLPVLIDGAGHRYAISVRPARPRYQPNFMFLPIEDRWAVLLLAVIVTTLVSILLARSIAKPLRTLARATRRLAEGALETRVGASIGSRSVELEGLARDFDAMAIRIQALVQSRDRLLRDVSHELRSPLARMRLALGLARQSGDDVPAALDRLDNEVERLDRLIGQVLSLARLDSTDPLGATGDVNLVELIDAIVRDARFEGSGRSVTVRWQPEVTACVIPGNGGWLASAVENVVRNALRYTGEGTAVEVTLRLAAETVEVAVTDQGPGVPEPELLRIFDPFYRVSSARGRDSGGDGIGLAIVDRVLRLHGGIAHAENRAGGGLTVRLTLPRNGSGNALSVPA